MVELKKMFRRLKEKARENGVRLAFILGISGMVLILISQLFGSDEKHEEASGGPSASFGEYSAQTEKRLEKMLSSIEGVGKAEVMITVGGTEEYVYAEEGKTRKDKDDVSTENEYVLIGSNGEKKALLQKVNHPEITGAAVICEGGDSSVVKERIYNTVSAALGIPSDRIFVTKLG